MLVRFVLRVNIFCNKECLLTLSRLQNLNFDGHGCPKLLAEALDKIFAQESLRKFIWHPCIFYDKARKFVYLMACGGFPRYGRPNNNWNISARFTANALYFTAQTLFNFIKIQSGTKWTNHRCFWVKRNTMFVQWAFIAYPCTQKDIAVTVAFPARTSLV